MPKAEEGRSQTTFSMNIDLHETAPDRPQRTGTNSTPKGPKSPSPPLLANVILILIEEKTLFSFLFVFARLTYCSVNGMVFIIIDVFLRF